MKSGRPSPLKSPIATAAGVGPEASPTETGALNDGVVVAWAAGATKANNDKSTGTRASRKEETDGTGLRGGSRGNSRRAASHVCVRLRVPRTDSGRGNPRNRGPEEPAAPVGVAQMISSDAG